MINRAMGMALVCLVWIGCKSNETESVSVDTPAASSEMALATFCNSALEALAARAETCQGGPAAAWLSILEGQEPNDLCSLWSKGVEENRIEYNPANAEACLTSLQSDLPCDQVVAVMLPVACQSAINGVVAVGGECISDLECTGDAVCDTSGGCPGICTARVAVGADCSGNQVCVLGSSCLGDTCVANAALGEECGATVASCELGLTCSTASGEVKGTCQPGQTSGACTSSDQCAPGYSCIGTDVRACVKARTVGEDCTPGRDECAQFTYCSAQGCAILPAVGERCDAEGTTGEAATCLLGVCDSASDACVLRNQGESCERNEDCASQYCVGGSCWAACGGAE